VARVTKFRAEAVPTAPNEVVLELCREYTFFYRFFMGQFYVKAGDSHVLTRMDAVLSDMVPLSQLLSAKQGQRTTADEQRRKFLKDFRPCTNGSAWEFMEFLTKAKLFWDTRAPLWDQKYIPMIRPQALPHRVQCAKERDLYARDAPPMGKNDNRMDLYQEPSTKIYDR
jgi:hypothetical protein